MDLKNNKRLKEIKLSIYLNRIDKKCNKDTYSTLIKLLGCVIAPFGKEYYSTFTKILQQSIGEGLLNASSKELIATCLVYFSRNKATNILGMSKSYFYKKYGDLLNRDFINEDFIESLEPVFKEKDEQFIIDFLITFIEVFKLNIGDDNIALKDNERTLEIEFYLIYDKLMSVIHNTVFLDKVFFNICNTFDIEYNTIANLKNNIHIINRSFPKFKYNNRYFMQEIVYLYDSKGLKKGTIGRDVLGRNSNYLYNNTNKKFNDLIDNDDVLWQYVATIDWSNMNKEDVMKFIDVFHKWFMYNE